MDGHDHRHAHGAAAKPGQRGRLLGALRLTWGYALVGAVAHGVGHATFQPEAVSWVPLMRRD